MKSIIEVWQALPLGKRMQLSTMYGIKDFGTTEEQLIWDLENKLPQGLLVIEPDESKKEKLVIKSVDAKEMKVVVEAPVEPETAPESVEEVKEVKVPKNKKKAKK